MFNFIDLFPFFQLMAGLNFAPSFFSSLQNRYFNPVLTISNQYQQKLILLFDEKIEAISKEEYNTTGLDEDEKQYLEELAAKAKNNSIELYNNLKNIYITEFKTQTQQINDKIKNIIDSDTRRVQFSFIISGIFCVIMLLFPPVSELFFPSLCTSIFIRYVNYFVAFQFFFQVVFFLTKSENYFSILCYYLISVFLIFISYIVYFTCHPLIPSHEVCNYVSYSWKKASVILLIISTLTTFWLYLLKYIVLLIINKINLKKEFNQKLAKTDFWNVTPK